MLLQKPFNRLNLLHVSLVKRADELFLRDAMAAADRYGERKGCLQTVELGYKSLTFLTEETNEKPAHGPEKATGNR
ncbi:hypothetical protein [Labrys sp. 22185]|uniref:hypothetical protein n=1 Tax=Labrys sp. 22185 TaxID=3453888 RepID=UPI003F84D9B2